MATDEDYAKRIEEYRKAYYEVSEKGLESDPEYLSEIILLGLREARSRINEHEKHLELTGQKRLAEYI